MYSVYDIFYIEGARYDLDILCKEVVPIFVFLIPQYKSKLTLREQKRENGKKRIMMRTEKPIRM